MSQTRSRSGADVPLVSLDAEASRALLRGALEEAIGLLRADGGLVYLVDQDGETLRILEDASLIDDAARPAATGLRLPIGSGLFGVAVGDRRVVATGDYANDRSFPHEPGADRVVAAAAIRSMIVAPLAAGEEILGALGVYSRQGDAFDAGDTALVRALAAHAATSLSNATLIEALERSRAQLVRRAESERTLRELIASVAAVHDADALLRRIAEAAITVTGADGVLFDRVEAISPTELLWIEDVTSATPRTKVRRVDEIGQGGLMGKAVAERRIVSTDDYLPDRSFHHWPEADGLATERGFRSVVAAPLVADGEVVGVIAAYSGRPSAFDDDSAALVGAFADHAAVAIVNARLIEALDRSRQRLARRVSEEQSLREIAARLTAIHETGEILEQAVAAACRLVGGEWAEVAELDPDGTFAWTHVYGLDDPDLQAEQRALHLRVGEGVLGLAAEARRAVVVDDYLEDSSFVHNPATDAFARRGGFRSLVAVPLIADDDVVGVLAVHSARHAAFDVEHADLVRAFADVAAIAIGNARLIEALDRSEVRYRGILAASPDIVFAVDPEGRFTFLSDTLERQLGWPADEMVGRHFGSLIDVSSMGDALERWRALRENPGVVLDAVFLLIHRDGRRVPYEIRSFGFEADGRFAGVQGSARDVSERDRLERDLRRQAADLAAGEERAHLARELHDSVTQALFSMTLVTRSIELLLERDPASARARLETLRELQRDALAEMRALIFELRPASLESEGLDRALRTHSSAVQGRAGVAIVIETDDDAERLPREIEAALFRIAQEALNNVVKHAAAGNVTISLERSPERACLTVSDDGVGFEVGAVPDGHMGLAGMRARAEKLGGRLEVESSPGRGTTIRVELPVAGTVGSAA